MAGARACAAELSSQSLRCKAIARDNRLGPPSNSQRAVAVAAGPGEHLLYLSSDNAGRRLLGKTQCLYSRESAQLRQSVRPQPRIDRPHTNAISIYDCKIATPTKRTAAPFILHYTEDGTAWNGKNSVAADDFLSLAPPPPAPPPRTSRLSAGAWVGQLAGQLGSLVAGQRRAANRAVGTVATWLVAYVAHTQELLWGVRGLILAERPRGEGRLRV